MLFRLYIGSNNETHKLEAKKAVSIVASKFEGLTVIPSTGYWKGQPEKSMVIEVETQDKAKVLEVAGILRIELKQQAIGLSESQGMQFIS